MSTVTTSTGVGGSSVMVGPHTSQVMPGTKLTANVPEDHAAFVRQIVGDGARVEKKYRSVDYWQGNSMSSTGLAYNISGRATVIEAGVGERLASFVDPIKAIFGTAVCGDKTVIVKRKYVVGGQAIITPERAPARTVQVREDVTTVELQRYGGDIEMNTNLFLLPGEAQAEMDMKLDAQKRELERKLVSLGYAEIFAKAVRLPDAVVRSNPTFVADVNGADAQEHARMVYFRGCFGAFAKHEFPLANLLASAKTATAYTSATAAGSVLIIPHGSNEMLQYTKKSSLEYSISGLKTDDHKPITMSLDAVAEDPSSGIKIMVHRPMPTYRHGSAVPATGEGLLSETVELMLHYPAEALSYPNLTCGGWKDLEGAQVQHSYHSDFTAPVIAADVDFKSSYDISDKEKTGYDLMAKMKDSIDAVNGAENFHDELMKIQAKYAAIVPTTADLTLLAADPKAVPADAKVAEHRIYGLVLFLAAVTKDDARQDANELLFNTFAHAIQTVKEANTVPATPAVFTPMSLWKMLPAIDAIFNGKSDVEAQGLYNLIMAGDGVKGRPPVAHGLTSKGHLSYRLLKLKMSSAIIAAGGSDTGELLVGYPMTGVSTNARTESMTVALRVYLGAILKRPENVLVIPHVAFEGIVHDTGIIDRKDISMEKAPTACGGVDVTYNNVVYKSYAGTYTSRNSAGDVTKHCNVGPLGHLDDPYYAELVQGLQVYKPAPSLVANTVAC